MKQRAPKNRTLTCSDEELQQLSQKIAKITMPVSAQELHLQVICADIFKAAKNLPECFVDLLVLDPPYNLSKNFNGHLFKRKDAINYQDWFQIALDVLTPTLKKNASIYVCSDWKTSMLIAPILEQNFYVRNRITWEREKGRGAKANWKNNTEDIWFCTNGEEYYFNIESVKLKRKVLAPYRENGMPKDWQQESAGNFRLTHPSNIWTDMTVPFWSMPENTDHPTQKPEKLMAKLILASSKPGDFVLDPFLGSGTTAVVAEKLNRRWAGFELNSEYCCWALKRIEKACRDSKIQGYKDGVFWERNSLAEQNKPTRKSEIQEDLLV